VIVIVAVAVAMIVVVMMVMMLMLMPVLVVMAAIVVVVGRRFLFARCFGGSMFMPTIMAVLVIAVVIVLVVMVVVMMLSCSGLADGKPEDDGLDDDQGDEGDTAEQDIQMHPRGQEILQQVLSVHQDGDDAEPTADADGADLLQVERAGIFGMAVFVSVSHRNGPPL
jgi:hypothetical protein